MAQSRISIVTEFGRELALRDLGSVKLPVLSISVAVWSLATALTVSTPEKTRRQTTTLLAKRALSTFDTMAEQLGLQTFDQRYADEQAAKDEDAAVMAAEQAAGA